jgi:calcium-dependent protein kinase
MATINEKKLLSSDRLQIAFKMFDKDNSGNITPAEIKSVLSAESSIPADVMKAIMQQVDKNGDG